jgi:cell surface protein SprA
MDPETRDSTKTFSKAKLSWYNRLPSDVFVHEIWPNRSVRPGQDQVTVLNLDYNPNRRGPYNFSSDLSATLHTNQKKNWAGIMRYISTTGGNIIEQNINYLEIWMKASSDDINDLRQGKLFVDIGRISEDVIPNGTLNSEDLVVNNVANGVLNPGEDVGLDLKNDAEEQRDYANFLAANAGDPDINPADPSGDDWFYTAGNSDYTEINGTEKNEGSVDGRIPDTEDLNGNGDVDLSNTYLEYEIPLDSVYYDSVGQVQKNNLIVGGGTNKWYQFRIPLLQATRVVPSSSGQNEQSVLENVQYVRMWVSGFEKPVTIRIAEMDLVGNQWQELTKKDSTMKVSVVNIEDNPDYTSPPNVIRERDRTQPDVTVLGNEQSLALLIKGLRRGESRQAFKTFPRPLDVFSYKAMKMFVHGDPSFDYFGPDYYDAEVFIRFGADTLNYYEYRQPIHPGWDPQNDININFLDLASVKADRDSLFKLFQLPVKNGPPGATYGVLGNPSLTQIRYMGIGVTHAVRQSRKSFPLTGEVWVNELRVVDVDNASGVAYRFDSQMKLADFGNVGFNYSKTDPNFHGLDQRFGNRIIGVNWALNSNFSLEKFFPQEWQGTAIPFGYSHSENIVKPRYLPNTDVPVDEAANRAADRASISRSSAAARDSVITESQTLHVQDSYSVPNLRIAFPTDVWYIRDTFSKMAFGFNYSKSSDRSPAILTRTTWLWNFRVAYGATLPNDYYIQPFKKIFDGIFLLNAYKDWKLYFMPVMSFNTSLNAQRSRNFEVARTQAALPRETRNFGTSKGIGFAYKLTENGLLNLGGDYSLSIDRTLLQLDNDSVGRGFATILKNIFVGGRDNRYGQRVSINSKPNIPDVLDLPKYFDLTAGYNVNYSWQNTFQHGDIGKSAGFDNSITLTSNFRLKALTDPWFKSDNDNLPGRVDQNERPEQEKQTTPGDTTKSKGQKTEDRKKSKSIFSHLKMVAYLFLKIPFLDYETINISFSDNNRAASSGVVGSTGFKNFWGRLPFQGSLIENGPSRLFQLGLISDPSGTLKYSPKSSFPFIGWKVQRGLRAKGPATLTDQYSQSNNITLRTNRPLWEGATLELNWKVGWQYNSSTSVQTDRLGNLTPGSATTNGSIERSFLSVPPVLFFKVFKSGLEDVGKKYDQLKTQEPPDQALAEAFEKGLESLPFFNKFFGQFFPRANWTLRWDGIEKIAGMNSVLEKMTLEHSYASSFKRDFRGIPEGGERTDIERVTNGFSPLLGVNATFKEFMKGSLSGNIRFNTTTTYDLNLSVNNIVETLAREISLSLTYSRRGFSFPLFGVNLNNDVDMTMTFSTTKNSRRTHEPSVLSVNQEGIPLEGNTRTVLEPRFRYVLSTRVTAALFYRYTKLAPDELGSLIPGTTTNEAGLDIHIAIQ